MQAAVKLDSISHKPAEEEVQVVKMFRAMTSIAGAMTLLACTQASAATVEVSKSPYCGCCEEWIEHMRAAGFTVSETNVEDTAPIAKQLGVPNSLRSCHTAKTGKYAIEGHVPAADVKRLLKEQPNALGVAVAGMPAGAPGMDQGAVKEAYDTVLFAKNGARVFALHGR